MKTIDSFTGEYYFLSNFFERPITYNGITYRSNEAAFQAQKCIHNEDRYSFRNLSPNEAKRKGRRVELRSDWEQVKIGIMTSIVRLKFFDNADLAIRLIETSDAELIEGNTWNDKFWGVDSKTGEGKNYLGRILMKIRNELIDYKENE